MTQQFNAKEYPEDISTIKKKKKQNTIHTQMFEGYYS